MLDVFAEVIAPVLLAAAFGGFVCARLGIEPRVVSRLSFFLFSPALVFSTMSDIDLAGTDTVRIVLVAGGGSVITTVIGLAVAGLGRADARTRAAVGLAAGMGNGGNLGLPVAALAFGDAGLEVAVVAFVTSAFVINTVGVVVATSAGGGGVHQLSAVARVPALWAAVVAFVFNASGLTLPAVLAESTATLGAAAVPMMLVVLGVQLRPSSQPTPTWPLAIATVVRLGLGPVAAWALALALGIDGLPRDTLVVLGGMPTAVYTTIVATQFSCRPALVTRAVVVSTLASVVTLTVLIAQYR